MSIVLYEKSLWMRHSRTSNTIPQLRSIQMSPTFVIGLGSHLSLTLSCEYRGLRGRRSSPACRGFLEANDLLEVVNSSNFHDGDKNLPNSDTIDEDPAFVVMLRQPAQLHLGQENLVSRTVKEVAESSVDRKAACHV